MHPRSSDFEIRNACTMSVRNWYKYIGNIYVNTYSHPGRGGIFNLVCVGKCFLNYRLLFFYKLKKLPLECLNLNIYARAKHKLMFLIEILKITISRHLNTSTVTYKLSVIFYFSHVAIYNKYIIWIFNSVYIYYMSCFIFILEVFYTLA